MFDLLGCFQLKLVAASFEEDHCLLRMQVRLNRVGNWWGKDDLLIYKMDDDPLT